MKRFSIQVLVVFMVLAGCGEGPPREGTWYFSEGEIIEDSCQFKDIPPPTEGDGSFVLANTSATTFTIDPADDLGIFECTLTGGDFLCASRWAEDIQLSDYGLEGVIHINVSVEGNFSSSFAGTGVETADVSCEGSGCAAAAIYLQSSFPCAMALDFTILATE